VYSKHDVIAWLNEIVRAFNDAGFIAVIEYEAGVVRTNIHISFHEEPIDTFEFAAGYTKVFKGGAFGDDQFNVLTLVWYPDIQVLKEAEKKEQDELDKEAIGLGINPDTVQPASAMMELLSAQQQDLPGPYLSIVLDDLPPEGFSDAQSRFPLDFNHLRNMKANIVLGLLQGLWGNGLIGFNPKTQNYIDGDGRDILDDMDATISPVPLPDMQ
jgi:hypothetical protein